MHLSSVPVRKPRCSLAGTIKPPFCETTSASTREGNNTPKIGSINSFSKSEFANPHHLKGLANSNHVLSAFTVPLLPGPRRQLFGVNPHQYWLPAHDGNFGGYGLHPRLTLSCDTRKRCQLAIPKNTAKQRSTSTIESTPICPKVGPIFSRLRVMVLSSMT
ncbi:hypothetical protein ALO74_200142 [Pseudomonas syringae pv. cunninghamiae]|nr:hypothetical protein ALO74_200142 [Pseudomonas syringae pv. cunninghamiae]